MTPSVVVHCGFGGLLTLASLPLIARAIPMNHLYGIRIRKAFSSDSNWYAINAFGGKLFAVYGVALVVFGVTLRHDAPPPTSIWSSAFVVGPMLLVFPLFAIIHAYARRLPE